MLAVRSRRPGSRACGVAPSDHGRDPSLLWTFELTPRSALRSSATGRPLCADAGAPAGLVQLEHLYTPGNCAGDAASVPIWIFKRPTREIGEKRRRTSATEARGKSPTPGPRPRRVPRPSPPHVHRPQCTGKPAGGPHTGTRHRLGTGGRRHRYRERPTRVPATRAAADPKPSPVPIQSRLVNAALRTPE
jgi:hypothetical protein